MESVLFQQQKFGPLHQGLYHIFRVALRATGGQRGAPAAAIGYTGLAVGSAKYINEIKFENDMIEFIFTFSPGMQDYHKNTARQYFPPFSNKGIIFELFPHFIPTCLR